MKASDYFIPTLREVPAEAEVASHQSLLRAGYIRKLGAGVYTFLPLAWRVIRKIEQILRDEMESISCHEMRMPTLHPRELLEETGRWNVEVVYKLRDRRDADFALGFTHEEVVTDIARRDLRSWRDLPLLVYQNQTKFRDEPRPRAGLMRTREFIMFDAYSFDRDEAAMDVSYRKFYAAYQRFFDRIGLPVLAVQADGGAIGDLDNNEFMTISPAGEDTVLRCPSCGFAANVECCPVALSDIEDSGAAPGSDKPLEFVSTPSVRTIGEVAGMLGTAPEHLVKTLVFLADGTPVAALVRGDHEINEVKLRRLLGVRTLVMADEATVERVTGAPVGFAGPVGLIGVRIIADQAVRSMRNFIAGANQADAHYVHVNIGRDFSPDEFADIRNATPGDLCPNCHQSGVEETRGIEVGHIFKLGTKYSKPLGADFAGESGQPQLLQMGSYGIGISRTVSALIEAFHDDDGIIWSPAVAPFQVVVIVANVRDAQALAGGLALHDALIAAGMDVLLDDRDERAGVKFKDADLVGYPVRVVIGKGFAAGTVEVRARRDASTLQNVPVADAVDAVRAQLQSLALPAAQV